MKAYNKIKNIVIAVLVGKVYHYACMAVPGQDPALIIWASVAVACCVYVGMLESDSVIRALTHRVKHKHGTFPHVKASGGLKRG